MFDVVYSYSDTLVIVTPTHADLFRENGYNLGKKIKLEIKSHFTFVPGQ